MNSLSKEDILSSLIERHGKEVQDKLSNGHVAIAGLGGLGSNVAFYLARIGVGYLHLIDFDRVDRTNLNRQQYFIEHLGMYKTDALKQELHKINPYLTITTDCTKVTEDTIYNLFKDDDIICEAFDVPEYKSMLVSTVPAIYPDKIIVAGSGMAGYGSSNLIHTRKITDHFYLCGDGFSSLEDGLGLMAPRVAICAAHQANMITRLLLNEFTT